jgi:thiol:disulfide interchange protein DsbD
VAFEAVKSLTDLDMRLRSARGRYVMLDFWAEWCVSCKEMDRLTFGDAQVQARLKDVLLLRADVTANSADDRALLHRFNLFGPPGIVFFDTNGKESPYRVVGFEPPEKFLASLSRVWTPAPP